MLDHSGWLQILPRRITPSDIDGVMDAEGNMGGVSMVIDNNGRVLLAELNSHLSRWADLPTGQRRLYESLVRAGNGKIIAALCRHRSPEQGRQIDTVRDIESVQFMYLVGGRLKVTPVYPGARWPDLARRVLGFDFATP